jgi:opacity protein-like surface antigen
MYRFAVALSVFAAFAAVALAQDEGTGTEPTPTVQYLPAYVFPAVYFYGGAARGPSYDAAPDITGRAAAIGLDDPLEDIGTLSAFGVTFDFFIGPYVAASLRLMQEQAPRYSTTLKYDYSTFPKIAPIVTEPVLVEEHIAYKFQNIDYKIALKYVAFPHWPITPYVSAGVGGNLTSMDVDDQVSNAVLQKGKGGALLTSGYFQQFSFDWALYAGIQVNLGDNLFLITEYNYDRQFHEHEVARYKYRTGLQGLYAGAGWRFL